jgi:hypothetical protein
MRMSNQKHPAMTKSFFLCITILSLYSCRKENRELPRPQIITDPVQPAILEQDTVYSGDFWGIRIGDSPEEIHTAIQQVKTDRQIGGLVIVSNIFTRLAEIETRIPLYNGLFMDEFQGTNTGVQIAFADGTVKSIYLNSGQQLTRWPDNAAIGPQIQTGDEIKTIYNKLVLINKLDAYKNKFERLSLFYKNLSTAYDSRMSVSPQWYFGAQITDKKIYQVKLNFVNSRLFSVEYTLLEYP